jgi:hypothetical protein
MPEYRHSGNDQREIINKWAVRGNPWSDSVQTLSEADDVEGGLRAVMLRFGAFLICRNSISEKFQNLAPFLRAASPEVQGCFACHCQARSHVRGGGRAQPGTNAFRRVASSGNPSREEPQGLLAHGENHCQWSRHDEQVVAGAGTGEPEKSLSVTCSPR